MQVKKSYRDQHPMTKRIRDTEVVKIIKGINQRVAKPRGEMLKT